MLVVITYDVNTETTAGRTRLRKVAKQCTNYGRRVQNSVFECILDSAQSVALKGILSDIIDKNKDSLRFYYLGNNYQTKIEHVGIEMEKKQCLGCLLSSFPTRERGLKSGYDLNFFSHFVSFPTQECGLKSRSHMRSL